MKNLTHVKDYYSEDKLYRINLFYDKYHHVMFVYKKKYGKYEEMKIVLDELNLDQEDVIKRAFAGL